MKCGGFVWRLARYSTVTTMDAEVMELEFRSRVGQRVVSESTNSKPMKIFKNLTTIALAAMSLLLSPNTQAADEHSDAVITWTKHITALFPTPEIFGTIAGVAGGDIGEGTVNGEAFAPLTPLP